MKELKTTERRDVLIVGAGLLGCFAARALAAYDLAVTVLEAREDVCTGISRANTGILYAGYDTRPGSLKSTLTLQAMAGMEALCRELDVPLSRCGSLMVSCGPRGDGVLARKYADGLANGVPGLRLLSGAEVLEMEPGLTRSVSSGLYAPLAGTLDPWALGIAAYENAAANGVEFRFSAPVEALSRRDGGFAAETPQGSFSARAVLNCAGLRADRVRELCEAPRVRIFPTAADYLVLDSGAAGAVRHIVFHEPEQKGKGLTLVPTVDGQLLVGPTERDYNAAAPGATVQAGLEDLRRLCAEVVPGLDLSAAIRSFGATRPNPWEVREEQGAYVRTDRRIGDFCVLEEAGLVSLIGVKTPGLTCAPSLGAWAAARLLDHLGGAARRTDFDPRRRGIPRTAGLSPADRAALIAADPAYGRILCRCRGVSEGEVLEAIRRGAVTVDGVKRRTGAGMGRCQGGFCQAKILALLARARGLDPVQITQDGGDSRILFDRE